MKPERPRHEALTRFLAVVQALLHRLERLGDRTDLMIRVLVVLCAADVLLFGLRIWLVLGTRGMCDF